MNLWVSMGWGTSPVYGGYEKHASILCKRHRTCIYTMQTIVCYPYVGIGAGSVWIGPKKFSNLTFRYLSLRSLKNILIQLRKNTKLILTFFWKISKSFDSWCTLRTKRNRTFRSAVLLIASAHGSWICGFLWVGGRPPFMGAMKNMHLYYANAIESKKTAWKLL